jgi:hypothetical protein
MREAIKLQRRKQLWQKRRSPINGIGLFAALPIRSGTPIIEFKGRIIPWEEGAIMLLRGATVIKFDANHDIARRSGLQQATSTTVVAQLCHQKEAQWSLVNQHPANRTRRRALNRLRLRSGRRI